MIKITFYHRTPTVYKWIGCIWLTLMIIFGYFITRDGILVTWDKKEYVMASLEILNFALFTNLFLFFSIQNFVYPLMYQHIKKKEQQQEAKILIKPFPKHWHPVVKLLYTTYNDFIPYALNECMHQTYNNVKTVILDNRQIKHTLI